MPRPKKVRNTKCHPNSEYFKPRGIALRFLEEVVLEKDELEAISLSDLDRLKQEEAANVMKISRPTFGRILSSAHQKIADAIINGKAIKISSEKNNEGSDSN
jgi:predicted DNA-binding protein (UPF0251 family)